MSKHLLAFTALCAIIACTAATEPAAVSAPAEVAAETQRVSDEPAATTIEPTAASVAPAPIIHADARVAIACDIRTTPTAHGVLIEATANAERDMAGEFALDIVKHGAGGDSDISQGGAFSAQAGEIEMLSGSEISLEPGARYRATLTLRDADGVLCRDERRS
jgi:hypothetical protein